MTIKPILFQGDMVRAIISGRKTQTRRVLGTRGKYNIFSESLGWSHDYVMDPGNKEWRDRCTPIAVGDVLYVRETMAAHWGKPCPGVGMTVTSASIKQSNGGFADATEDNPVQVYYRADMDDPPLSHLKWKPAIHAPRWSSRLTLEVTDVRWQRIREISDDDAIAEGISFGPHLAARDVFRDLWDRINGPRGYGWDVNPWVAAITFTTTQQNIDKVVTL